MFGGVKGEVRCCCEVSLHAAGARREVEPLWRRPVGQSVVLRDATSPRPRPDRHAGRGSSTSSQCRAELRWVGTRRSASQLPCEAPC